MRLFAPAKINLGLEVCGKRDDGYHEVVTLLESVSIFDVIDIRSADELIVRSDDRIPDDDDLIFRALDQMQMHTGRRLCLSVTAFKSIPISAGLGGGSSDAGTVLGAIGMLLGLSQPDLHMIASSLGSDVPFFLRGGATLATGTGTDLEPIASGGRRWYVIAVPDLTIPGKTASLYAALTPQDHTDGVTTRQNAETLQRGGLFNNRLMINAFQRPLLEYEQFRETVVALHQAGAETVVASGAGPSAFAACDSWSAAARIRDRLNAPASTRVFLATSIGPNPNQSRLDQLIESPSSR